MKSIKVMHIILDLGPGGAERVVLNYLSRLDRTRFEPVACILRSLYPKELAELKATGVRFYHLRKPDGFSLPVLWRLIRIIRHEQPAILHLHNYSATVYGTLAGLMAGRPAMFRTEHNIVYQSGEWPQRLKRGLKRNLKNVLGLYHRHIIAVSDGVLNSQRRFDFLGRHKYRRIYNGIGDQGGGADAGGADAYPLEFGLAGDEIVFLNVANLHPQKAHDVLLQAARKVLAVLPRARFLVAGGGPRRTELEQLARRLGLAKQVTFLGNREDVPALLRFADVFVLSSDWEGFPMTILEAMASGTPVVVTDVGGNREAVLHGVTGLVVRPRDPQALADALIDLGRETEKRLALGKAARLRFEQKFTADTMVRITERFYLEAFAASSPAPPDPPLKRALPPGDAGADAGASQTPNP